MAIEIKAPSFPESVADGTVATWHKKPGDAVKRDDLIVDIETDKVVLEVLAEADGVLGAIVAEEGATVLSNQAAGLDRRGQRCCRCSCRRCTGCCFGSRCCSGRRRRRSNRCTGCPSVG